MSKKYYSLIIFIIIIIINYYIILIKNQTDKTQNGIYVVTEDDSSNKILIRHQDFTSNSDLINKPPLYITVSPNESVGNVNGGDQFVMTYNSETKEIIVTPFNDNVFSLQHKTLTIYATNYNVFRIMSGMGSLLFSS